MTYRNVADRPWAPELNRLAAEMDAVEDRIDGLVAGLLPAPADEASDFIPTSGWSDRSVHRGGCNGPG